MRHVSHTNESRCEHTVRTEIRTQHLTTHTHTHTLNTHTNTHTHTNTRTHIFNIGTFAQNARWNTGRERVNIHIPTNSIFSNWLPPRYSTKRANECGPSTCKHKHTHIHTHASKFVRGCRHNNKESCHTYVTHCNNQESCHTYVTHCNTLRHAGCNTCAAL